jgi:hypothetical protein
MRPIKPNAHRRSLSRTVLLAFAAIVIGGAGTVALLAATKVIDPAKLAFWRNHSATHPAGSIPIPLSGRLIPAYTEVTGADLRDARTGAWVEIWEAPDKVPKGVITNVAKIIGRVTSRQKAAPFFFTESDFLPLGTPAGIVGGTPQGKRAITLDASRLKGCVFELKQGDHLDVLASVPVDMPGAGHSGSAGATVMSSPNTLLRPKRSFVNTIVNDGVVVSPVTARVVPTTNSSLMNGATTRNVKVQEIVLAVAPNEVAVLDEAMDLKYQLTCVARSGRTAPAALPQSHPPASGAVQGGKTRVPISIGAAPLGKAGAAAPDKTAPDKAPAAANSKTVNATKSEASARLPPLPDVTPGLDPMADIRFMEVMIGSKRQFMLFTGPGNSPVPLQDDGSAKPAAATAPADAADENQE